MREHQVIIVCGETGSGKTTQLPKMALAMGRAPKVQGKRGQRIGHTQPRRIAASSVAKRIAEELKTPLGDVVGYKVSFQDRLSRDASVKLMTDGILLAETQNDPLLKAYDTLIIDEAQDMSLVGLRFVRALVNGDHGIDRPDGLLIVGDGDSALDAAIVTECLSATRSRAKSSPAPNGFVR